MRLPTYDEISRDEEQLNVYETPFDESLFVVGPPGSGKDGARGPSSAKCWPTQASRWYS